MSLPLPKATSGNIILFAKGVAKPGRADEAAALLAKVRTVAESGAEPNNLTYRTIRSENNPDEFIIFEEYVLPNGLDEHGKGEAFQALLKADVFAKMDISYWNEFK